MTKSIRLISAKVFAVTLTAGALVTFAPAAMPSIIASDNFDGAVGELNGRGGGSGWFNNWTAVMAATEVVNAAVPLVSNPALQFTGNNDNVAHRQLASEFTGDTLFVDFYVQLDTGTLNNNDFLALWLDTIVTGTHNTRPNIGIKGNGGNGGTPNDVFVRTTGTAGNMLPNSNLATRQTYHIVGRLSRSVPGNYTQYDAWLDPLVGDLGSPDASFVGNAGISSIKQVGFRTANLDPGDILLIDDLQLSTTWEEALRVPVPEPTSLALISLGLLLGMGQVRHRRA